MTRWWEKEITPRLRRNRALRAIFDRMIFEGGQSHHSSGGHTLRLMIERLEDSGTPYVLTALPGRGYHVAVLPPTERAKL